MHGIFISTLRQGVYYVAERSQVGRQKFIWSRVSVLPDLADHRIEPHSVPHSIRRAAYRWLAK